MGAPINLVSGLAEITEGKLVTRIRFDRVSMVGHDLMELRRKFVLSKYLFGKNRELYFKKVKAAEEKGAVRLVELRILKVLGETVG